MLGQLVLGFLLIELGLEVVDRETPGIEFCLLGRGIDFHQQLTFLDLIAHFYMQLADLSGRLRTDIYVAPGLQSAQGGDTAFDIAAGHCYRAVRVAASGQGFPGEQGAQAEQAQAAEQQATGVGEASHAGFPARKSGP
ncbi:hypothetical protein D3C79_654290 [compost metagenome]